MKSGQGFTLLQREQRLSAQAADQILHLILDQKIPIGSKLPSERQLAEALGVSRTVVREAIRLLEARKVVDVQTGSGAVVKGISPAPVTESIAMLMDSPNTPTSFGDVQEVRRVLELSTVALAAQRATPDDLALIALALQNMMEAASVDDQIQADYDFHLAIARATHNQVFILLLQALNDILVETWRLYWEAHTSLGPEDYVAADKEQAESDVFHKMIYEAIKAGDPIASQRNMEYMLSHWSDMYSSKTASTTSSIPV